MPTGTYEYRSEQERVVIEQAIAFISEMHDLAQVAPNGQVLHSCEGHTLSAGRDLLRASLQQAVQHRIASAEKKTALVASVTVLTLLGFTSSVSVNAKS